VLAIEADAQRGAAASRGAWGASRDGMSRSREISHAAIEIPPGRAARRWWEQVRRADERGTLLVSFTGVVVVGARP
jgi:hypothetical protein